MVKDSSADSDDSGRNKFRRTTFNGGSFLPPLHAGARGTTRSVTDKFTREAMSTKNNNLKLPFEEFCCSAPAFQESNAHVIDAVFAECVRKKLFASNQWNPEAAHIIQEKPTIEQKWAFLFGAILSSAGILSHLFRALAREFQWCSRELHPIEGHRKPDVILVPKSHSEPTSGSVLTCCEIKDSSKDPNALDASTQLLQVAGYATSCQINRVFFHGAILCGEYFSLVLHLRGSSFYSQSININASPLCFIKAILTLSAGIDPLIGFDPSFELKPGPAYWIDVDGDGEPDNQPTYSLQVTPYMYYRCFDMTGKGTKVAICSDANKEYFYALKETFLLSPGPNDVQNHAFYLGTIARSLSVDEEMIFGETDKFDIFRGNKKTFGTRRWDGKRYFRGIPVLVAATVVKIAYYGPELEQDSTETIIQRFTIRQNIKFERRIHCRTVSETCGISVSWFSCRREFLNAMMCAASGHFNGLLKNLLHCDPSEANIWLCVNNPLDPNEAIPDWPKNAEGELDKDSYPKRSGVLGDWGMAELQDKKRPVYAPGGITGTYPFLAAELFKTGAMEGRIRHQLWHDLEALFWVIWIVSVNSMGPYHKRRGWAPPMPPPSPPPLSPSPDNMGLHQLSTPTLNLNTPTIRTPADAAGGDKRVPLWATPGLHECDPHAVFQFKRDIPEIQFKESMSPYWRSSDAAGKAFLEGMLKLRRRFIWEDSGKPPSKPITHIEFIETLKEMRDSIPAELDCYGSSNEAVEEARERYRQLVDSNKDLGVQLLEVDFSSG